MLDLLLPLECGGCGAPDTRWCPDCAAALTVTDEHPHIVTPRVDPGVPVFAPLSRFGNMGAASGVAELACTLLALKHGKLPGTLNHAAPYPGCPITVHTGAPRPVTKPYAVKVSATATPRRRPGFMPRRFRTPGSTRCTALRRTTRPARPGMC